MTSMPTTGTMMVALLGIRRWSPSACHQLLASAQDLPQSRGTMLQGSTRSPQLTPEPEVLGDCARVPRSAPKESDKRQGLTR